MPKIFINYVITPKKELVISSYHEKVQSFSNGFALIKKDGLKPASLIKLEAEVPSPGGEKEIKEKLLEVLTGIKNSGEFEKVTYRGDLNLCTLQKEDVAVCLFDGTLNAFFPGKEVNLILESANKEYVENGIKVADAMELKGAVLQTKTGVPKDEVLSKSYPQARMPSESQRSEVEPSPPPPDTGVLAQSQVKIKEPQALASALGSLGLFKATPATVVATAPAKTLEEEAVETVSIKLN